MTDHGVKAATAEAVAAAATGSDGTHGAENPGGDAVPMQLPLLPAVQVELLPLDPLDRVAAIRAPRGPGRPAGAVNKRTEGWAKFLLSRYQSPLIGLAETYSRPVADLAMELGCTKLEAFKLQMQAKAELAPYLHGKMPVEISLLGELPTLAMVDPRLWAEMNPAEGRAETGFADLEPIPEPSEEDQ